MILFLPIILGSLYLLIKRRDYSVEELGVGYTLVIVFGFIIGMFFNMIIDINFFKSDIKENSYIIENIEGIPGGATYIELESGNTWTIDNSILETDINPSSENPTDFNCFTHIKDKSPGFIWYMGIHERLDPEFHITNTSRAQCLEEGEE